MDPEKVLKALEKDQAEGAYRRFEMAIALLKATIPNFEKSERLKVVLFGH